MSQCASIVASDEEEFQQHLQKEAVERIAFMEHGSVLVKFNASKGMFGMPLQYAARSGCHSLLGRADRPVASMRSGKKSDASRMVERWVVVNNKLGGRNAELSWGDPKTKRMSTTVRLSECRRVLYGHASSMLAGARASRSLQTLR